MIEIIFILIALGAFWRRNLPLALFAITFFFVTGWILDPYDLPELIVRHSYYDTGNILVILLCLWLKNRPTMNRAPIKHIKQGVFVFFMFIILCCIIDMMFNNTPLISQVKTLRHWIPMSLILFCHKIHPSEGLKYLRLLTVGTFICSSLFIFEQVTGIYFLGVLHTVGGERSPLPLPISALCFAILLYHNLGFSNRFRWLYLSVLFVNLVMCGSRSVFILYVAIFGMWYVYKKFSASKVAILVGAIVALVVIFNTDNILSRRFAESKRVAETKTLKRDSNDGNLIFRLMHAQERLNYVLKSPQYTIFGIGNVEEKKLGKVLFQIDTLFLSKQEIRHRPRHILLSRGRAHPPLLHLSRHHEYAILVLYLHRILVL